MCLAVAQNIVDLLWAVGGCDHSGRLQVKPFACPRQNAPNCALHAALIMRVLYLNFPIADVTAAYVGLFRRQLGELLQRSRETVPSFCELNSLTWPELYSSHSRGSYQSSNMPPRATLPPRAEVVAAFSEPPSEPSKHLEYVPLRRWWMALNKVSP